MGENRNRFEVFTKEIAGVEYKAQFNGLRAALGAADSCYVGDSGNISSLKLMDYLFENVVVEPKGLSVDDFDDMDILNRVVEFAREVMYGRFRKTAGKKTVGKTGTE